MQESILQSIKKLLGVYEEDNHFDTDIIFAINTVLGTLYQIGVGDAPVKITGPEETWDLIVTDDRLENIKDYVYAKTRLIFDPPTSSAVMEAMKEIARELEFRISVVVDPEDSVI